MATNSTISDKDNFKVQIIDAEKFIKLSQGEQKIWEILRNSLLEIMPYTNNKFDDEAVRFAENYAFINLKAITVSVTTILDSKISEITKTITSTVLASIKASTTATTTKTGT